MVQPESLTQIITRIMQFVAALGVGKSAEQKSVEYQLSQITNEIEKALDLNSMAFRAGYISQAQALSNYDVLWSNLLEAARQAAPYTAAQAQRTVADRDYGGIWANIWRGTFRDDRIMGIEEHCLENGFVAPACQWDFDLGTLKYGASGSDLIPGINPGDITTPAGERGPLGLNLAGVGGNLLVWLLGGAALYIGYKAFAKS